jgi:hypothetical protein
MACAVSCWVCIASIVKTAPARSANAVSSSRTAGISFDFSSTATWPRTAPIPCARAATRCGAFLFLLLAPRTVNPGHVVPERRSANVVFFNEPAAGGHLFALEQPETLIRDIRATFAQLT